MAAGGLVVAAIVFRSGYFADHEQPLPPRPTSEAVPRKYMGVAEGRLRPGGYREAIAQTDLRTNYL